MKGQLNRLVVLPSTKEPTVGTEYEALWAPEPIRDAEEKNIFCFWWELKSKPPITQSVAESLLWHNDGTIKLNRLTNVTEVRSIVTNRQAVGRTSRIRFVQRKPKVQLKESNLSCLSLLFGQETDGRFRSSLMFLVQIIEDLSIYAKRDWVEVNLVLIAIQFGYITWQCGHIRGAVTYIMQLSPT